MNYCISSYISDREDVHPLESNLEELTSRAKKNLRQSKHFNADMLDNDDLISNIIVAIAKIETTVNPKHRAEQEGQVTKWEIHRLFRTRGKAMAHILPSHKSYGFPEFSKPDFDDLEKSMGDLTQEQRKILNLRYYEDLSYREIGLKLNKHYTTVKNSHDESIEILRKSFL